jgi:hypothetical protein
MSHQLQSYQGYDANCHVNCILTDWQNDEPSIWRPNQPGTFFYRLYKTEYGPKGDLNLRICSIHPGQTKTSRSSTQTAHITTCPLPMLPSSSTNILGSDGIIHWLHSLWQCRRLVVDFIHCPSQFPNPSQPIGPLQQPHWLLQLSKPWIPWIQEPTRSTTTPPRKSSNQP